MASLEDVLKKLGWDDGFQMPVANSENQALEQELLRLSVHKIKSQSALESSLGRLTNLKDHFKYVHQENEQTQKLITAHKQQYDSERNQYHTLKGEKSKLSHDITEVNKRLTFLEERKEIQKNDLEKAVVKVDKVKQETGWDIEALKAWEEALKKRDDDNELIKKFSKEDERKFNELEAKRQLLQSEFNAKCLSISKIVCDLHSCEMIIERTGKAIKQQVNEREKLIKQWKDSVKMLQQRDNDIDAGQERILAAQKVLEKRQELLEEEHAMLNNEKKNNHDAQMEIDKLNYTNSRMRRDYNELHQNVFTTVSQCAILKRQVVTTANNLEHLRMEDRAIDQQVEYTERKCIKDQEVIDDIGKKIKEMKGSSVSSGERIKKIQKMIENEEKHCSVLMGDTEKINSNLFRTDQILKEQQQVGRTLGIQIDNDYYICTKLRKHIRDEQKALETLKEVVYDMQFRIDEFEQRLCKLEGSNKQEDHAEEKEEKIRELEKTLADHAEVQHTLQSQVDRLQDEMRKLSNFIAADKEKLETLHNKVENHLLEYDIGRKQIAAAKKSTQEKQVEENIMRLRINHIELDMDKEDKKIFNLQKLRLALDQVMKERNIEIETKKSIVLVKRKNIEEEKGRLRGDISLRKVKLEQMKKKYHIELMSLGKDKDGQPLSVTHFKIKNAQDKFMLQQQGDELDQKIRVIEKEIVAIENTLKMVNLTNVAFKNNLSAVKEDAVEVQEMKALEKLHKMEAAKFKQARDEMTNCESAISDLKREIKEELEPVLAQKREVVQELEADNLFIEQQENKNDEKRKRTEMQLRKTLKKLGSKDCTIYEQDIETRQLREANNSVIKRLNTMTNNMADVAPNIKKYTSEYSITLESETSLSASTFSTVSSVHSSSSSARSLVTEMTPVLVKKVDISFK